ncbi:MAG: MotA/TolQ/ExbB proton channel family protein, partial [Proteobacteria bacterium]|nr:MotA/TolQ/ExbB proton channel family protein [Pseudomonadota bacterium]
QCAMREMSPLRRFLSVIAVLAAVAPLFGLLGTVTGMMTTFDVIAVFGTGNAKAMAGGISEALITTQSGLLVAIPGLFMSVFLIRRADHLESNLDELLITLKRNL